IADERTDTEAAVRQAFDAIEPGQARDVDQTAWVRNAALHQVEQIGAGREISSVRSAGGGDGIGNGRGPDIFEIIHAERLGLESARLCRASSTASVMPA